MSVGEHAGDAAGIDAVALRTQLERAVARLCPRWMRTEREDLVQASIVRVLEALSSRDAADPHELNATYLWKTAYSTVLDELRRARRRPEVALDDSAAASTPSGDAGPHVGASARELARKVRECLAGIDAARRYAVQLRLAGFAHEEIASLIGGPLRRASNLVFRGMEDLRSCLRGKGVPA